MADSTDFNKGIQGPLQPYAALGDTSYLGQASASASSTSTAVGSTIQHNNADIAVEPKLNFVDGGGVTFTVTDDSPNTRVTVSAASGGSSQGSTFPSSPSSGQVFFLVSGISVIPFIYDGTHWYSQPVSIPLINAHDTTPSQLDQQGSPASIGTFAHPFHIADAVGAGCTVQLCPEGVFGGDDTGLLYAAYSTASSNGAPGSITFLSGTASSTGSQSTPHYAFGSFSDGPTSGSGMIVSVGGERTGGGGGETIYYYQASVLVRYKK